MSGFRKKEIKDLKLWEGDKIFLRLLDECEEYFSLKLVYEGDTLVDKNLSLPGKNRKQSDRPVTKERNMITKLTRSAPCLLINM